MQELKDKPVCHRGPWAKQMHLVAVAILTAVSAALCVYAFVLALWYLAQGFAVSAILDFAACAITLAGAVFGAWWLWNEED